MNSAAEAVFAPAALIGREWRRDVLLLIGENGAVDDIADGVSSDSARRSGAEFAPGPVAPSLAAVLRESVGRICPAPEGGWTAAEREALAAAVYGEIAAAGFTRLCEIAPDSYPLEPLIALERAAERAGLHVCVAPAFDPRHAERPAYMEALGVYAAHRRREGGGWGMAIAGLSLQKPMDVMELGLALAQTDRRAPRHLRWRAADEPDEDRGRAKRLDALVAAASLNPAWALSGADGEGGASVRKFAAAGGVVFGPGGPPQPDRRRGVEIDPAGPTCPAALLRASYGAPEDDAAAIAIWRSAAEDGAAAVGAPGQGALRIGAWADLVAFDASHPALAAAPGASLLRAFIAAGDARAVKAVMARGRWVAMNGRHTAMRSLTEGLRDALWRAAQRGAL